MSKDSKIEWTDHTFNPWWGCTRVSPGCAHCYAETTGHRFGVEWGKGKTRRPASEKYWREPIEWNRDAELAGIRSRVFCASMADVFDHEAPVGSRVRLWALIRATPWLDWLLLTKRPENILGMLPGDWGDGYPNVWLGTTVENQSMADERIPLLLQCPAAVRFLSCEPLLGRVYVSDLYIGREILKPLVGLTWYPTPPNFKNNGITARKSEKIHWVICGGESGPGARPMHPDWARSLRDQCAAAGVPFFFKQWGEWSPGYAEHGNDITYDLIVNAKQHEWLEGYGSFKVGKKAAGRLLDGREHNDLPGAA